MVNKHVPIRMCIVTREKLPKKELARFVWLAQEKKMVFDSNSKARGRGANIKGSLEIYDKAVKSGAFKRALSPEITQENFEQAREEFKLYLERAKLKNQDGKVVVRINSNNKIRLE